MREVGVHVSRNNNLLLKLLPFANSAVAVYGGFGLNGTIVVVGLDGSQRAEAAAPAGSFGNASSAARDLIVHVSYLP